MVQGLGDVHAVDPDRLAILGGLDLLDHVLDHVVRPLHVHVLLAPLHAHPEGGLEGKESEGEEGLTSQEEE